ncbi:MAG: flagellar biosynthetic protein FliR [Planctomycetaceae bacterium]
MDTLNVVEIGQDFLLTAMWLSGPAIIVSLVVGLLISLAQTVTSVQEQTLSFAPRIVAVGGDAVDVAVDAATVVCLYDAHDGTTAAGDAMIEFGTTITEALVLASLLIFFRVSAFIAFLPPLNGQGVPATVKIGLSVALTFLLANRYAPILAMSLDLPGGGAAAWLKLAFLGIRETALGAGLAWLFSLCLVPVRIAGAWIAQEMGLTLGGLSSPMDQQPSNVISTMLEAFTIILFFVLDLHHLMLYSLGQSFAIRPAAGAWSMPSWETVVWSVTHAVDDGFLIVAPIAILLFVVSLTILITMRTAPQFNFMSYGMTLRLGAGLCGLMVFLPEICEAVQQLLYRVGQGVTS